MSKDPKKVDTNSKALDSLFLGITAQILLLQNRTLAIYIQKTQIVYTSLQPTK